MSSPRECVAPTAGGWSAPTLALPGRLYDKSPIFAQRPQEDGMHTCEGLCEDIGQLVFSICVVDGDVALQHMVTKKMMTNLDVLCL